MSNCFLSCINGMKTKVGEQKEKKCGPSRSHKKFGYEVRD